MALVNAVKPRVLEDKKGLHGDGGSWCRVCGREGCVGGVSCVAEGVVRLGGAEGAARQDKPLTIILVDGTWAQVMAY